MTRTITIVKATREGMTVSRSHRQFTLGQLMTPHGSYAWQGAVIAAAVALGHRILRDSTVVQDWSWRAVVLNVLSGAAYFAATLCKAAVLLWPVVLTLLRRSWRLHEGARACLSRCF